MRFSLFVLIYLCTVVVKGQLISQKFDLNVLVDNFEIGSENWIQKYNINELLVIKDGAYFVEREGVEGKTLSFLKLEKPLQNFSFKSTVTITKRSDAAVGFFMQGQLDGSGAYFFEINSNKQMRVVLKFGSQVKYLLGVTSDNGWVKVKQMNKTSNQFEIRTIDGKFDIYVNDGYFTSFEDSRLLEGFPGFFVNSGGGIKVDDVIVKKADKYEVDRANIAPILSDKQDKETVTKDQKPMVSEDDRFQEVIVLFKTKIDQQQAQIMKMQRELDKAQALVSFDTTIVQEVQTLRFTNTQLTTQLEQSIKELNLVKKRLSYLESMKQDVERGSNGDLIINLTTILSEIKQENAKLKSEKEALETEKNQLSKDNILLMREIEKIRNTSN